MKSKIEETCDNCGTTYQVILIAQGIDYNDFGFKFCPFCGIETDE